jgi:hypothetical protein
MHLSVPEHFHAVFRGCGWPVKKLHGEDATIDTLFGLGGHFTLAAVSIRPRRGNARQEKEQQ